MNDKHRPNSFDDLFDDLLEQSIPQPDAAKKQQALQMAKKEFNLMIEKQSLIENSDLNKKNHQETLSSDRRIDNQETPNNENGVIAVLTNSIRGFFMNTNNNSFVYKTFGTAAVAFLAISTVFMLSTEKKEVGLIDDLSTTSKISNISDTSKGLATSSTSTNGSDSVSNVGTELHYVEEVAVSGYAPAPSFSSASSSEQVHAKIQQPVKPLASASETILAETTDLSVITSDISRSETKSFSGKPNPINSTPPAAVRHREQRLDQAEEYAEYKANTIKLVSEEPVSTFSIDVDTASYSLVRNQLNNGFLPSPQAVRPEEFINYFDYNYPTPKSNLQPFEPTLSVVDSPWNTDKKLVHVAIKGYDIEQKEQPDSNLVFLLDVSGSMNSTNKLPLVKQSVNLLLDTLKPTDTVSIVVYAGSAGTVLEPTKVKDKTKILEALQRLSAGGSTAGGAGIELAYQLAEQNFNKEAVNRIILATDGDFNVGQSNNDDLKALVERKRNNGVLLSVLGFGRNNYQDDMAQTLAQNGNGTAAYIDSLSEAKKVLVDEATSTLFTIAKDVKIQVEFNPATVSEYRLIGYETRALNREDFNNDKVDAGDIGAGHTVTAIYEITPANAKNQSIDEPRYADNKANVKKTSNSDEYGFLKIRYKLPDSETSTLIETPITQSLSKLNSEVSFSIAVAGFAQLLSNNKNTGKLDYSTVIKDAINSKGEDPFGYRSEFIQLVRMAEIAKP